MPATGPAALDERPRWGRAAVIAAPWAVAGLLGAAALTLRPATAVPSAGPSAGATPTTPTAASAAPNATGDGPDPAPPGPEGATAPPPRGLPPETHLQVLAAARAALGTAGLEPVDGARGARWPLDVRLVTVAAVTDTVAVATVHGLVIHRSDTGWTGPFPHAVAVPLTTTPDARVAGPAWPLPAPTIGVVEPDARPVADPDPAVVAPLADAGWVVEEVVAVDLVDGAVLRVEVLAVAPGDDEAGRHVTWLLDAPGGPRLLPLDTPDRSQEST